MEQSKNERATWKNMLSSTLDRRTHFKVFDADTGTGQFVLIFAEMEHHVTCELRGSTLFPDLLRTKNYIFIYVDINECCKNITTTYFVGQLI